MHRKCEYAQTASSYLPEPSHTLHIIPAEHIKHGMITTSIRVDYAEKVRQNSVILPLSSLSAEMCRYTAKFLRSFSRMECTGDLFNAFDLCIIFQFAHG